MLSTSVNETQWAQSVAKSGENYEKMSFGEEDSFFETLLKLFLSNWSMMQHDPQSSLFHSCSIVVEQSVLSIPRLYRERGEVSAPLVRDIRR